MAWRSVVTAAEFGLDGRRNGGLWFRRERRRFGGANGRGNILRGPGAEHHRLEQRIGGKAVGAVRARRGDLAAGPQAFDRGPRIPIGEHAAHVVVRRRRHRDRLPPRVDAGRPAGGEHGRELRGKVRQLAAIEKGAAAAHHFAIDASRDDVAGAELGIGMERAHEAFAACVDEGRAFAAKRFGRERRRIAADVDRGGMELNEFGVGDDGAGAGGDGDAFAARFAWIGGDGVELPRAAGRKHHGGGIEHKTRGIGSRLHALDLEAGDAAVAHDEVAGRPAFDHMDRGHRPCRRGQRRHDGAAGGIALHMEDAAGAVGRLAAEIEMALEVLVEGNAIAEQVLDAVAGLACEQRGDALIDDAGAGADGVGGMRRGAVALGQRGGDARLRPHARAALAERRHRDHGDGKRRELERGEEAGEPGPDDDDAALASRLARGPLGSGAWLLGHRVWTRRWP